MSAGLIAGTALRSYEPLTTILVPAMSVHVGKRPDGAGLNNILVKGVSWTRSPQLAREPSRHVTERIQVSTEAANHQDRTDILKAIVNALDLVRMDAMGDLTNIAIVSAGGGPDFEDDAATIFLGSRDFFVDYDEPA